MLFISLYSFHLNFEQVLAADHLIIRDRTKFDIEQKSLKFLLEVMTLVSANNVGSTQNLFSWEDHLSIFCSTAVLQMILGVLMFQCIPVREKVLGCIR
jgi:hypothetical protein